MLRAKISLGCALLALAGLAKAQGDVSTMPADSHAPIVVNNGNGNGNGHGNGNGKANAAKKKLGGYSVTVSGDYRGKGSATIDKDVISIQATVKLDGGEGKSLKATDLTIDENGYFTGTGVIGGPGGQPFTISGRVDVPAGNDAEQSPKAKDTARISATFQCQYGTGGRLIGEQTRRDPAP